MTIPDEAREAIACHLTGMTREEWDEWDGDDSALMVFRQQADDDLAALAAAGYVVVKAADVVPREALLNLTASWDPLDAYGSYSPAFFADELRALANQEQKPTPSRACRGCGDSAWSVDSAGQPDYKCVSCGDTIEEQK